MVIVPNLMYAVVNLDLVGINAKMLDVQVRMGCHNRVHKLKVHMV